MKNKKGQSWLMAIVVAFMVVMAGFLFAYFLQADVDTARTALDCESTNISDGNKLACLGTDITIPYWIYGFLALAGSILMMRVLR
jgi:hypothetical protein